MRPHASAKRPNAQNRHTKKSCCVITRVAVRGILEFSLDFAECAHSPPTLAKWFPQAEQMFPRPSRCLRSGGNQPQRRLSEPQVVPILNTMDHLGAMMRVDPLGGMRACGLGGRRSLQRRAALSPRRGRSCDHDISRNALALQNVRDKVSAFGFARSDVYQLFRLCVPAGLAAEANPRISKPTMAADAMVAERT